jgi:putative flippase GtrA
VKFNLKLPLLYATFALIATAANLLMQKTVFLLVEFAYTLFLAMFLGTLIGLVVKYVLDKKWIFRFTPGSKTEDFTTFVLYTVVGIFTTLLFIAFEMTFYFYVDFAGAQYVGGGLGLMFGYTMKYFLDKQYVFKRN